MTEFMRFWRDNRVDGEFTIPIADVATAYLKSDWEALPWPLVRKVNVFLIDPDGPIGAGWDPDDPTYDRLLDVIEERLAARYDGGAGS